MSLTLLPGLPSTNANVVHLHRGHPTPHREGIIAQCNVTQDGYWIANAQPGCGYANEITFWGRANCYIWIVQGAVYLIRLDQAYSWRYYDDYGIICKITPDESNAILATYTDLICLDLVGYVVWRRSIAIDGIEIQSIDDAKIHCNICYDPPDGWMSCVLNRNDGS